MCRRRRVAVLTIPLCLGLAACGSDTESDAVAEAEPSDVASLTVVATDVAYDAPTYEVSSGQVEVTLRQEGQIPHTLVIEDDDGREVGTELVVNVTENVDSATIELAPGSYVLWCRIPGHRGLGQEATLTVS
ncbi:MAG: hypothetical protein AAGG08_01900 [Actinomycetota bacterium]